MVDERPLVRQITEGFFTTVPTRKTAEKRARSRRIIRLPGPPVRNGFSKSLTERLDAAIKRAKNAKYKRRLF